MIATGNHTIMHIPINCNLNDFFMECFNMLFIEKHHITFSFTIL